MNNKLPSPQKQLSRIGIYILFIALAVIVIIFPKSLIIIGPIQIISILAWIRFERLKK